MAFHFRDLGTMLGPEGMGGGPDVPQAGAAALCFRWTFRTFGWGWWTCWWGPWWRCCGWVSRWCNFCSFRTIPLCGGVTIPDDIREQLIDPREIGLLKDDLRRQLAEIEKVEAVAKKGPKAQIQMMQDQLMEEHKRLEEAKKQIDQGETGSRGRRGRKG